MASIVDPNQMAYSVVSDLVLHFLLRHACPNSLGYYGTFFLTLVLWTRIYPTFANSVDPDQLASEEANWSGSALFAIKYVN